MATKAAAPKQSAATPEAKMAAAHEKVHEAELEAAQANDVAAYTDKFTTTSNDPRAKKAVELSNKAGIPLSSNAVPSEE